MRLTFLLLFLTGCAAQTTAVPVPVKLPVALSCAAQTIAPPDWNVPRLAADAKPSEKLKAVLADLELSKAYISELQAELVACS